MKKEINNYILLVISIILYFYIMFKSNINFNKGKKELENILILAIPCFIFLISSFNDNSKEKRRKFLFYYLIIYFVAMNGFVFSNFRMLWKNLGDVKFIRQYNLIPFHSIIVLLKSPLGLRNAFYNIIGNFLMLIPLSILLPLINEKFKNKKNYIILILAITFLVEITQFITNTGSFDVDDIILNFSGSFIAYLIVIKDKVYNYLYKFFYKKNININIIKYSKLFLYILLIFVYIIYFNNFYRIYKDNIIDLSNLTCVSNEKTYITTIGEYDYFSECKYSGYVSKGTFQHLELKDYLKFNLSDDILNELKITKEKWLNSINIKYGNSLKSISKNNSSNVYFLGIDKIEMRTNKNDKLIVIENDLPLDDFNYMSLVHLVENSESYVIFVGEYYDVVGCTDRFSSQYEDYIISKYYKYDNNFCSKTDDLKKNMFRN